MRRKLSEAAARAEADLRYWGYHIGKQYAADGYPDENPLLALLSGHSDLNPVGARFGVNMIDVPADAWRIHQIVLDLPRDLRDVLIARYCLPVDESGRPYEARVLAEALRLSVRTYFRKLADARRKYLLRSLGAWEGIRGIRVMA